MEPIQTAERSVVRIITITLDINGQISDVDSGSGFVVAPGKILTNHHVIAGDSGAAQVKIFVIPERDSGGGPILASVEDSWSDADLALIDASVAAPPLSIALQIPLKDATIHAIGYPGVTDTIRRLSPEEILSPAEPYVTPGSVALLSQTAPGGGHFDTIFHTAPINPGNSGGPLVDGCGRVIGVNTARAATLVDSSGTINTPEGQSSAIESSVLVRFLVGQPITQDPSPCVPPLDASVQARLDAAQAAIATEAAARKADEDRLARQAAQARDVGLLAGAIAGAVTIAALIGGLIWIYRTPHRPAANPDADPSGRNATAANRFGGAPGVVLAISGVVALIVGIGAIVFSLRAPAPIATNQSQLVASANPAAAVSNIVTPASAPAAPAPNSMIAPSGLQHVTCTLSGSQSFNALPGSETTGFFIAPSQACVNGRTLYERTPAGFTRVMRADATDTVSVLDISPSLGTFRRRDYALTPDQYAEVAATAGPAPSHTCETATVAQIAHLRAAAAPFTSGMPFRQTTWVCAPAAP